MIFPFLSILHSPVKTEQFSPQTYAKVMGIIFLISIITGVFGEIYVPGSFIVSGDASATAFNLKSSEFLFRLGFASYLIEALCDITLTFLLYVLLRPVNNELALLAAFFRLVSTATFAIAEFFYFSSSAILNNPGFLKAFSVEQQEILIQLFLNLYGAGGIIFMVFIGVASVLFGYLMYKSRYFPRIYGALLLLGGAGFILKNFMYVLAPVYSSDLLMIPMALLVFSLPPWLLSKGINMNKWEEMKLQHSQSTTL
ncbi:MAG: DUF4386 domain-containing protein [Balneolaceae bacterium]|nr:DUF4386 domain-containing protein [Balneolaceae bacterium]